MEVKEQYDKICSPKFHGIQGGLENANEKLDQVLDQLRGNGNPGLTERVRALEKTRAKWDKLFWIVLAGAATVVLHPIANALASLIKDG